MLKSALRLLHVENLQVLENGKTYEGLKFIGKNLAEKEQIRDCNFRNFVFADCGMRRVYFINCQFDNCIFAGCYLKEARFIDCTIRGSHFEICELSGLTIESTTIEHIEFFRCVFPYQQVERNIGDKHAPNDRMLLNCASEAHRIGRWPDAEQFIALHLKEKRKLWRKDLFSTESFYRKKNLSSLEKIRTALRLSWSSLLWLLVGDRTSIMRFISVGLILLFVIAPFAAFLIDKTPSSPDTAPIFFISKYGSYLGSVVNLVIGQTIKIGYTPNLAGSELFEVVLKIIGISYLAILGNLLTKSIGFGPKW